MKTKVVIAILTLLTITLGIAADEPDTSSRIVTDKEGLEECKLIISLKGKGKTEAEAENDLKEKAWWNRADVVHVTGKTKKGFRGDAYRCRKVRITSNPEAVRGCEPLKTIEIYRSFSSMLGTKNPVRPSDLASKAWRIGADVIMIIDTDDNSGSAEAYFCGQGDTEEEINEP